LRSLTNRKGAPLLLLGNVGHLTALWDAMDDSGRRSQSIHLSPCLRPILHSKSAKPDRDFL
jgi:hypothetical protein